MNINCLIFPLIFYANEVAIGRFNRKNVDILPVRRFAFTYRTRIEEIYLLSSSAKLHISLPNEPLEGAQVKHGIYEAVKQLQLSEGGREGRGALVLERERGALVLERERGLVLEREDTGVREGGHWC